MSVSCSGGLISRRSTMPVCRRLLRRRSLLSPTLHQCRRPQTSETHRRSRVCSSTSLWHIVTDLWNWLTSRLFSRWQLLILTQALVISTTMLSAVAPSPIWHTCIRRWLVNIYLSQGYVFNSWYIVSLSCVVWVYCDKTTELIFT